MVALKDFIKPCFITLLLVLPLFLFSQTTDVPCEKLLDEKPSFIENHSISEESVQDDFKVFIECGNFSQDEFDLITPRVLSHLRVNLISENKELSYNNFISELKEFFLFIQSIEISTAEQHESEYLKVKTPELLELTDIESAIQLGKANNKKVILFFGGYGDAHTYRIIEDILTVPDVRNLIDAEFMLFIGYVDDRTQSENSDLTIGKEISNIQIKRTTFPLHN